MKLLLLLFLVIGCYDSKCPNFNQTWRGYKYGDQVLVTTGFFQGQKGLILKQDYKYIDIDGDTCAVESFNVRLEYFNGLPEHDENIAQINLYKSDSK